MALPKQAKEFRREVRRVAAAFISQRISHAQFVAATRKAAVEAGIVEPRRTTRADRTMNALAWGRGSIAPGELPAALEPLFDRLAAGSITADAFAIEAGRVLDQVKAPE